MWQLHVTINITTIKLIIIIIIIMNKAITYQSD